MRVWRIVATLIVASGIALGFYAPETNSIKYISTNVADTLAAFPSAKGYGATALDMCRDSVLAHTWVGKLWHVANTNATGAGSLSASLDSAALYNSAYNIIVFDKGGLISFTSDIPSGKSMHCLYVAGQTAPGGGITFTGRRIWGQGSTHDVVWRYVRYYAKANFSFIFDHGNNTVLDHISAAWTGVNGGGPIIHISGDTTSTGTGAITKNTTLSSSLIFQPNVGVSTVAMCGGEPKSQPPDSHCTMYRNVLIGPGHRVPMCSADTVQIVENIGYNQHTRGAETNNQSICDFIGNYWKPGPATEIDWRRNAIVADANCATGGTRGLGDEVCTKSIYLADNRTEQNGYDASLPDDSAWAGSKKYIVCEDSGNTFNICPSDGADAPVDWRRLLPLPSATYAPTYAALSDSLLSLVLDSAGVSKLLNCDGTWRVARNTLDSLQIINFDSTTGPNKPVSIDTLNVPVPSSGSKCADIDNDGLPNAWEKLYTGSSIDSTSLKAWNDNDGDGYLNIEEYLNGTNPLQFTDPNGSDVPPNIIRRYFLTSIIKIPGVLNATDSVCASNIPAGTKMHGYAKFTSNASCSGQALIVTNDSIALISRPVQTHLDSLYRLPLDSAQVDSVCTAWGIIPNCTTLLRTKPVSMNTSKPSILYRLATFFAKKEDPSFLEA